MKSVDVVILDTGAFQKLDTLIELADVNFDGIMFIE